MNPARLQQKTFWLFSAFILGFLLFAVVTVDVEYYDAFEYLNTGMAFWGDSPYIRPKNPVFSTLFALTGFPYFFAQQRPPLEYFHFIAFLFHLLVPVFSALWIKRHLPSFSLLHLCLLVVLNRIFLHMAPFTLPDLFCAMQIALWLYFDDLLPLHSKRSAVIRALLIAFVALCRFHGIVFIAGGIICRVLIEPDRRRALFHYFVSGLGSVLVFSVGLSAFFSLLYKTSLIAGLTAGIDYYRNYGASAYNADGARWPVYFGYWWSAVGVPGVLLAGLGIVSLVISFFKKDRQRFRWILPALSGSAFYLLAIMSMGTKEVRYLAQLMPLWGALYAFALVSIAGWLPSSRVSLWTSILTTAVLFFSMVPEVLKFTDPYYRSMVQQKTAKRLRDFAGGNSIVFLNHMHAFYPKEKLMHPADSMFYIQHWAPQGLHFLTGMVVQWRNGPMSFEKLGIPIPDQIESLAPEGMPMALPISWGNTTVEGPEDHLPPLYALKWFRPEHKPAEAICPKELPNVCVLVFPAFPGFSHASGRVVADW